MTGTRPYRSRLLGRVLVAAVLVGLAVGLVAWTAIGLALTVAGVARRN